MAALAAHWRWVTVGASVLGGYVGKCSTVIQPPLQNPSANSPMHCVAFHSNRLGGGLPLIIAMASTVVADTTAAADRVGAFTVVESIVGVGACCAALLGGYITTHHSLQATLWAVAAVSGISVLLVLLMPESLRVSQRRQRACCSHNSVNALRLLQRRPRTRGVAPMVNVGIAVSLFLLYATNSYSELVHMLDMLYGYSGSKLGTSCTFLHVRAPHHSPAVSAQTFSTLPVGQRRRQRA